MISQANLSFATAASLAVARHGADLLTEYELGVLLYRVLLAGGIEGRTLSLKTSPARRHFLRARRHLVDSGALSAIRGLPLDSVYRVMGGGDPDPEAVLCTVDPFAFVSHLGAMALHGLTDRIPSMMFATTPDPVSWRERAEERMEKDLGEALEGYREAGFPLLVRRRFERILGRPVHLSHSSHLGAFKKLEPGRVRVSTLGRTFLDMLREPDLCGGIAHVLDVFAAHAGTYAPLIVAEVEQHGGPIDKVRAGYVLEERCGLDLPVFASWLKEVKRGGSRKLVGNRPYASTYSEKWCLSLNVV